MPQQTLNRPAGRPNLTRRSGRPKPKGKIIKIHRARLSFPDLYEPRAMEEGQEPKYGCTFLLNPNTARHAETIKELQTEYRRMQTEYWGNNVPPMKYPCMGPGEDRTNQETGEVYAGYEGMFYLSAKSQRQPKLRGPDYAKLEDGDDRLYAGVFANGYVNLWIMDNKWGKAVLCAVNGVMTLGVGDAFGGNLVQDKDFEEDFDAGDEMEYDPEEQDAEFANDGL